MTDWPRGCRDDAGEATDQERWWDVLRGGGSRVKTEVVRGEHEQARHVIPAGNEDGSRRCIGAEVQSRRERCIGALMHHGGRWVGQGDS